MNTSTATATTASGHGDPHPGSGRDAHNREYFALRRLIRQSRADERTAQHAMVTFVARQDEAKRSIERERRAKPPVSSDRATSERRVSWQALRRRARVISADGRRVGAVEHVLADVRLDIFDGVVIDTRPGPGGRRFVDAAEIAQIFPGRIVLTVPADEVRELPRPSRNPGALSHHATDPMPSALRLKVRRLRDRVARRARPRAGRRGPHGSRQCDA